MIIQRCDFECFETITKDKKEGIVLLSCGGDLMDWIEGVTQEIYNEGISLDNRSGKVWNEAFTLTTTGGRVDLALTFKDDSGIIDVGKLALWRLRFGDCSWISDYLVNYKDQHEVV